MEKKQKVAVKDVAKAKLDINGCLFMVTQKVVQPQFCSHARSTDTYCGNWCPGFVEKMHGKTLRVELRCFPNPTSYTIMVDDRR